MIYSIFNGNLAVIGLPKKYKQNLKTYPCNGAKEFTLQNKTELRCSLVSKKRHQ